MMPLRAPLRPVPIVEKSFHHIALDIASTFPKSSAGHQYSLVILDYDTRYPKAVPMRFITAPKVAEELIKCVSQVRIPQEILMVPGANFMFCLLKG